VQHAFMGLYLFLLMLGSAFIAISAHAFGKTREQVLGAFLLLATAFTLYVLSYVLALSYANLNLEDPPFGLLAAIVWVALVATAALAFAIPNLAHALIWEDPRRIRTIAAAVVALAVLACERRSLIIDPVAGTITQERGAWLHAAMGLFLLAVVYGTALKLLSLGRLTGEVRRVVRHLLILDLFLLAAFPLDLLLLRRLGVMIVIPVAYVGFCVTAAVHIGRRYLGPPAAERGVLDLADIAASLAREGISPREYEVIELIARGADNRRIADALCISLHTVKTHNRNIFRKLNVRSRFELVMKLQELPR
jgi:DNA-binding CsgD family transcriptional regulator